MRKFTLACLLFHTFYVQATVLPFNKRVQSLYHEQFTTISKRFNQASLMLGAPVLIRIFKESKQLELWVKDQEYVLYKKYPICSLRLALGPKLKEGDLKSPEGFYNIGPTQFNPWSQYHLGLNIGYPNVYDQSHQRTGSHLMIHGDCVSAGCFAMTDEVIEEIYLIVSEAVRQGQDAVPVHIFPFHMSEDRLDQESENPWYLFWQNLKEGYDLFEQNKIPPEVTLVGDYYQFARS